MSVAQTRPRPVVTVVGSVNMDITATVESQPRPGETVLGTSLEHGLGGKGANQAVAARLAGASVRMVGAVGADAHGDASAAELSLAGVECSQLARVPDAPSGTALIVVSREGENSIVVVPGANARVDRTMVARSAAAFEGAAVCVVQGEIPAEASAAAVRAAAEAGALVVANLAPVVDLGEALDHVHVVVVNEIEAAQVAGVPVRGLAEIASEPGAVAALAPAVVVTGGAEGTLVLSGGAAERIPAPLVDHVVDTTGAGDAFVGVLAARLGAGADVVEAARAATWCASDTVRRPGASGSYADFAALMAGHGEVSGSTGQG